MNAGVFILPGIVTVLVILYIAVLFCGSKYSYIFETLDPMLYPMRALFTVGFTLNNFSILRLRGKIYSKLRTDALLIHGEKFQDFYANVVWAQTLTYAFTGLVIIMLLTMLLPKHISAVFVIITAVFFAYMSYYALTGMSRDVKDRGERCMRAFPDMISKLAILMSSGMILRDAWIYVAEGGSGDLYDIMRKSCDMMRNGSSDIDAIHYFGVVCGIPEIRKFSGAMIQSMEKGGSDLMVFLAKQSSEIWVLRKQIMLQKGEAAASKLIGPIALMFIGVLIIVIAAAFSGFSL